MTGQEILIAADNIHKNNKSIYASISAVYNYIQGSDTLYYMTVTIAFEGKEYAIIPTGNWEARVRSWIEYLQNK